MCIRDSPYMRYLAGKQLTTHARTKRKYFVSLFAEFWLMTGGKTSGYEKTTLGPDHDSRGQSSATEHPVFSRARRGGRCGPVVRSRAGRQWAGKRRRSATGWQGDHWRRVHD